MPETFLALFAAHLLSDFALQWDRMVRRKKEWPILLAHIAIVGISAAVLLGASTIPAGIAVIIIVATHLVIDLAKLRASDTFRAFAADQFAHLVVVIAIAATIPDLASRGLWAFLPGDAQAAYYAALVFLAGFIVAVPTGGIIIKKLITPLVPPDEGEKPDTKSIEEGKTSMPAAEAPDMPTIGRYIGWLERSLTFLFIIARQPEGVGFLLAAKSVLRIGDLRDETDRSHAEYIIIGTFLSFGWGLVTAYITIAAASHWMVAAAF